MHSKLLATTTSPTRSAASYTKHSGALDSTRRTKRLLLTSRAAGQVLRELGRQRLSGWSGGSTRSSASIPSRQPRQLVRCRARHRRGDGPLPCDPAFGRRRRHARRPGTGRSGRCQVLPPGRSPCWRLAPTARPGHGRTLAFVTRSPGRESVRRRRLASEPGAFAPLLDLARAVTPGEKRWTTRARPCERARAASWPGQCRRRSDRVRSPRPRSFRY